MTNVSVYLNILYINYIFRRLIFMNEGILIAYDDTYYRRYVSNTEKID